MSVSNDDGQERFALGLVFTLVTVVVASVVGFAAQRSTAATDAGAVRTVMAAATDTGPAPAEPAALAPAAVVVTEQAAVRVDGDVVKFFFATGKTEVAAGAQAALVAVVDGAKAGKRVKVSGFHDATGDAAVNAELAKRRAIAVQQTLLGLGLEETQVELAKPEQTLASGSNDEARRVEVFLID